MDQLQIYTLKLYLPDGRVESFEVPAGVNLRRFLLEVGYPPYAKLTERVNCGGRGLCATCGVWLLNPDETPPVHWHDKAAHRFGYPRLSCQITVDTDLEVCFVDKWIWGNQQTREADTAVATKKG